MVHHPKRAQEDGSPKFWLLFFLGLVIVLVLFRAFGAAVDRARGETAAADRKQRKQRKRTEETSNAARKDTSRRVVHSHVE